jgi:hypothetical protein
MSDPKDASPDEDLLEFLGGIDEVNDDSADARDENFADFLAHTDIDRVAAAARPPTAAPPKEEKHE